MTRLRCHVWAPEHLSRAVHRIVAALTQYAPPEIQVVPRGEPADHRVIQTIGWAGLGEAMGMVPTYSIFQLCRETSENGSIRRWAEDVWQEATVVASYYPLEEELHAAGLKGLAEKCRFYLTPLGVDTAVFKPTAVEAPGQRMYLVGTSGYVAESECVGEWTAVARRMNRSTFHLGPQLPCHGPNDWRVEGEPDSVVAVNWAACRYVSGLRRTEGFELPAAEGLCCGARPVLFDRTHHRMWFGEHAEYIQEGHPALVEAQLMELVAEPYRPVTPDEIAWARRQFSWETMARGFWAKVVERA